MKLAKNLALLSLALLVFSCKKKNDDDEAFSKKLSVTTSYTDVNSQYVNQSSSTSITVPSGSLVTFNYNIGGQDGFGNSSLKDVVTSFDYTKESASEGAVTCTYVRHDNLVSAENTGVIVNENTKFTFKITSKDGETATVGPIEIIVSDQNEIVNSQSSPVIESNNCFNCYKFFAPNYAQGGIQRVYYNTIGNFFNPEAVVLAPVYQSGAMYLVAPSELATYSAYADLRAAYPCGWNATIVNNYTGSINVETDYLSFTDQTLDTLTINGSNKSILAVPGNSFVFKTPEGKKGIGKFLANNSNPFTTGVDFVFAYQK